MGKEKIGRKGRRGRGGNHLDKDFEGQTRGKWSNDHPRKKGKRLGTGEGEGGWGQRIQLSRGGALMKKEDQPLCVRIKELQKTSDETAIVKKTVQREENEFMSNTDQLIRG